MRIEGSSIEKNKEDQNPGVLSRGDLFWAPGCWGGGGLRGVVGCREGFGRTPPATTDSGRGSKSTWGGSSYAVELVKNSI